MVRLPFGDYVARESLPGLATGRLMARRSLTSTIRSMNSRLRILALVATVGALPLALQAQSGNAGTSSPRTSPSSGSSDNSASTSSTRSGDMPSSSSTPSSTYSGAGSTSGSSLSSANSTGITNIHRISSAALDRQFTAKDLIGKDVYDNQNKKVGEVKDVVLDSSQSRQLASALSMKAGRHSGRVGNSDASASGSMGNGTASGSVGVGNASVSGSVNTGMADNDTDAGRSSDRSRMDGDHPRWGHSEPSAIISYGGFLGMGDNLLRVPISQLNYDSAQDRLTLNVTETELSSLKTSDTSRSAAE